MTYKKIMNLVPTIQAAHLASENLKALKKKKMKSKDFVGLGILLD